VATSELGTLVRALNLNPTETEISDMQSKVDPKGQGSFTLDILEKTVQERGKDKESLQDLVDALKVFDSDHDGKITVRDFKHAMMTMGERMGETEIDEIVGDSELVNNDYIAIEDFAKMIMNRIWATNYNDTRPYINLLIKTSQQKALISFSTFKLFFIFEILLRLIKKFD